MKPTQIALCIAFALALTAPVEVAQAFEGIVSCDGGVCIFSDHITGGLGMVMHIPDPTDADERRAKLQRERAWEEYCKPFAILDKYGVTRYSYTDDMCAFGKWHR